ncbi:hypothetical protein [Bacillus thuringiensis]|uniref:hypothetical protein n=1 Tax=Bacillus thuringiensis TaxID=1428 RepID=UPI0026E2EC42|nr:hypothetical protein [Bacillus thuringiensis]MDO6632381.1 hypothetical protein [Bacillus thuringiensis]MDO6662311.1 hypothetical protein [Bacillus thuringiensis]MDO6703113.1 hypothetical protein [Bacillus thuringiensis]
MKSTIEEKQKRELLEIIFNRPIKGEGYIHGSSYKWKQIVFQHYNKIKRKEITIEELIKILQKGVPPHAHQLKSVNKLKFRSAGLKHS